MKKITDIQAYVEELDAKRVVAHKTACVRARQVENEEGEDVTTYVSSGIVETVNHANKGDWIVTKTVKETGEPFVDAYGHTNDYVLSDNKFNKRYVSTPDARGCYLPHYEEGTFVQVPEDIQFTAPWGEEQTLLAGGYLNVTNPKDIYGVGESEFADTYTVKDAKLKANKKIDDITKG